MFLRREEHRAPLDAFHLELQGNRPSCLGFGINQEQSYNRDKTISKFHPVAAFGLKLQLDVRPNPSNCNRSFDRRVRVVTDKLEILECEIVDIFYRGI